MIDYKLIESIKKEFEAICLDQNVEADTALESNCQQRLPFLERLVQTTNSSVAVFDVANLRYCFFQSKFKKQLGFDIENALETGPAFFISLMHPDDIPFVFDTFKNTACFIKSLPIAERLDYKLVLNCRIKDKQGKYVQMVLQLSILDLDKNGNIRLVLVLDNLLSENMYFKKVSCRLINMVNRNIVHFKGTKIINIKEVLSVREIEIIKLCSIGLYSKEIADKLSLSINTVNNHKQNILKKMNAGNTAEAVYYCEILGVF